MVESSAPANPAQGVVQTQYLVILSIAACHFINDVMQSVLSASYPLLHEEFGLSFSQIGLMSLAFMGTASVLQPLIGTLTDRHHFPQSLTLGMGSTLLGLLLLANAPSYPFLLMGAALEEMLQPVIGLLDQASPEGLAALTALDVEVNRRHADVKLFLAALNEGELSEDEARRSIDLTGVAINLEHAGDILAKTLAPLAQKKAQEGRRFSEPGWAEMQVLHARVLANLQLAMNVLISADPGAARALMREKEVMRGLERESHEAHLARLRAGNADSVATSHWHLETVRAFKEINSLLVAVAVPILEERGMVLRSRLAEG